MNIIRSMLRKFKPGLLVAGCWLALCGCVYNVPITAKPTRQVDTALLGNWTSQDGKEKMKVGKYDDFNYVLIYDGELYHAWHSDVAGTPFFTVEGVDTNQGGTNQYSYSSWKLAADGTLHGRGVNDKVIPDATKDSATVRKLLKENLKNPDLFGDEIVLVKDK